MKVVSWMLIRLIATRYVAILLGISILALSLELVAHAKEIQALQPGSALIIFKYLLMRAPSMLANYMPISILLAMLLALTELSYRNEMVALWSTGMSPVRFIVLLLPLAFLLGGLHFVLRDTVIPATIPQLRDWGIGDFGRTKLLMGEQDPIWMRAGPDILRAGSASPDSTVLHDVIIFRRDENGLLREQIYADTATLSGDRWTLKPALVYYRDNLTPSRLDTLVYSGAMKPAAAGTRSGEPEEMSLRDLAYFIDNQGFGIRPVWVYQTWQHKRITLFFTSLLMMAMCVPLASRFRRGGGLGALFAIGVGMGFVYFIIDGVALTMGELGFVSPWLGAWIPLIAFGFLTAVMALRAENV